MKQSKGSDLGQALATTTILEKGHAALRAALGDAGAVTFLQQMTNHAADGQKRSLTSFDVDRAARKVVMQHSRPTVEVRMTVEEAKNIATQIYGRAVLLEREGEGEA